MAYTTIDKPDLYFNTKLYTGNGGSQSITGVGFQPDWVWLKERPTTGSHKLYDAIRGATEVLESNGFDAEGTDVNGLTSFDSDGFSLGSSGSNNESGKTYVAWNWLASNTTASNTDGALASTVSANTTSGFSIVQATGTSTGATTIGHGLGVAPKVIIKKQTSQTSNWSVYHDSVGATQVAELNLTNAFSGSGQWGNTAPTSTVFTNNANSGVTAIYYCFAEKKGFSKFGSYTGNGNADGTFVYTGFKPAFVIIKNTNTATDWELIDNKRLGYNDLNYRLSPNTSGAEQTTDRIADILSNGFKIRNTSTAFNGSGNTMIYMAFAENPFTTSTGIPTTAR